MRGRGCARLLLSGFAAASLWAPPGFAEDAPKSSAPPPPTIIVLDASKGMNSKIGRTTRLTTERSELAQAVKKYGTKLSLGLVAFGHRKASNCADVEIRAKAGELTAATQAKLLDVKAKGQSPIGAALANAAKAAPSPDGRLDIVLIAGEPDDCDSDICVLAHELKEKRPALRISVVGFASRVTGLDKLSCAAAATGGDFITATNPAEFKFGLAKVLDAAIAGPPAAPVQQVAATAPPAAGGPAQATPPLATVQNGQGETAVNKAPGQRALTLAQRPPVAKPKGPVHPVPVTFKALVTEAGPKLQTGLTWRVYSAARTADGSYKLLSTHREAMPTEALMPGEYFVNAAYGLSNLTKKITVETGHSLEETFILNTGGLRLAAVYAHDEPLPDSTVRFDIQSDEEDQFGNRRTILANAKPKTVIRLNAGAYHIESTYGDANAKVQADVTVEPGKITEATLKHNGAKITFKLVQTLGGEALADTKWKILTSAGDVVKENAGALPTHILAAGSYAVVAEHGGLAYTRKFSIEPGETKQVEVVMADGPTSAEALQALLDPPEPPAPPESAEDDANAAVGVKGFTAQPADPNAPLINPGVLFRPSR
jgi:hypothetical protein